MQLRKIGTVCFICVICAIITLSCDDTIAPTQEPVEISPSDITVSSVAGILSSLPIAQAQLEEVYEAVSSSSGNGYDEEYMMADLFDSPGSGVGDTGSTRAGKTRSYDNPLRDMFTQYFRENMASTRGGETDVEACVKAMVDSGMQIYWPYSEDWDGKTYPIVTFDPGYGSESNYGYEIRLDKSGERVVNKVIVDEETARTRPVWVINTNDDSAYTPLDFFIKESGRASEVSERPLAEGKTRLYIKNFTMLRNYDSWFGGASEFFIKCGAVDGFKAADDNDLKLYTPKVTDFMIVVKRKQLGLTIPLDALVLTDLTDQMETLAFLIVEDDGGTTTNWKCEATVKYNSKSYGFDLNIPYKDKDDIVWRGQLNTSYFDRARPVEGRFGDVKVSFQLR